MTTSVSLRSHLKLDELPLATTESGKKFVMKALHPADHEIKATRVPGGIDNTVALALDQIFDYELTEKFTKIVVAPLADAPVMIETSNDGVSYGGQRTFQPPIFGGSGLVTYDAAQELITTLRADFESLTLTSQSVTVEFVAPNLKNQGTIAAAQFPNHPQIIHRDKGTHVTSDGDNTIYSLPFALFDDYPQKSELLAGTRAYTGPAREGCYMPLRISNFKQHYLNDELVAGMAQAGQENKGGYVLPRVSFSNVGYMGARVGMAIDNARLLPLSDTWGVIYVDGYAENEVSIRVRVRATYEGRVFPGSTYASLAEPPPAPDSHALRMYRELAGRLVNAYPASYNDWNTLKKTILSTAYGLLDSVSPWLPFVKALPYGSSIATIAKPMIEGGQAWLGKKLKQMGVNPNNIGKTVVVQPAKKPAPAPVRKQITIVRPAQQQQSKKKSAGDPSLKLTKSEKQTLRRLQAIGLF